MSFKTEALNRHNEYRRNHGVGSLTWSSKLESSAQNWANNLAKKGYMQHEQQNVYGENIAVMKGSELTGGKATDMWYDEIKDYNFNNPGYNSQTGHFTQVVWADSKELGMAKAVSSNGMEFVVARYFPAGNNLRTFKENVKPPGSKKVASNNTVNVSPTKNVTKTKPSPVKQSKANPTTSKQSTSMDKGDSTRQSEKDFKTALRKTHNMYRKRHGAAPLKWNSSLAQAAQEAAEEAAQTNTLRSVDTPNVGQNMAAMTGGELPGDRVSTMWYDEEKNFDYNNPGFSSSTGSFTQLIWKSTKEMGAGRAFGKNGQTFVVVLYKPPGNIRSQYVENIGRPTGPVPNLSKSKKGSSCQIM
ncbi:uncharacterized protein LOC100200226 isoform X2 [Hydra vulgaris]|uniref:Uncharacterized protein LOC100200226 isoform X2 n=1 Tax=Hydra vulgaris TaxID=6087 RepID=A0ABM4CTQ7_HYDVU